MVDALEQKQSSPQWVLCWLLLLDALLLFCFVVVVVVVLFCFGFGFFFFF